ncbi:MAG: substrate-binding domain-containing protein [Phycisphaerae bacterium]
MAYAREHGNWTFTTSGEAHDLPLRAMKRWSGDGIICIPKTEQEMKFARELGIPAVTFLGFMKNSGIPRVMIDPAAIGRMAAEHLLSRGYKNFAFYGVEEAYYSTAREAEFTSVLTRENFSVSRYISPAIHGERNPWDDEIDNLCRWIKTLPSPVGIFAMSDSRARMIADACRIVKRDVPKDVGIIGVDNDLLDCELGSPKLTSIQCDWWELGFRTAKLLDALMNGATPSNVDQLIPPTGIVPRASTDITIVDHPAVAKAVDYVQRNLTGCFGVKAMVAEAGVSRRYLEHSFIRAIRRTPAEYLAQARVSRAKELLQTTHLPLGQISRECGFSDMRQFRRVFSRLEKMTPGQYRKLENRRGTDRTRI